jgi:hypothetical protein
MPTVRYSLINPEERSMTPSSSPIPLPGAVRQVGYIVPDLDTAIEGWVGLGVGPWFVLRGQSQTGLYRGQTCTVPLSIAFANSGDLQIELIQQQDGTPSIYTEFVDSGRGTFHQLGYWADDFDAALASAEATGWPVVWSGGGEGSTRYVYLEPPAGPAAIIELMELTPQVAGLGRMVREAADGWDGQDPVRTLG